MERGTSKKEGKIKCIILICRSENGSEEEGGANVMYGRVKSLLEGAVYKFK